MSHRIKHFAAFAIFAFFYLVAAVDSVLGFDRHQTDTKSTPKPSQQLQNQVYQMNTKFGVDLPSRRTEISPPCPGGYPPVWHQPCWRKINGVASVRRFRVGVCPSCLIERQLKARKLFDFSQKDGRLHAERPADVEDAPQRGVGLPQLDETDEGSLIAGLSGKSLLAHLLP
jgi:hypothetical protein